MSRLLVLLSLLGLMISGCMTGASTQIDQLVPGDSRRFLGFDGSASASEGRGYRFTSNGDLVVYGGVIRLNESLEVRALKVLGGGVLVPKNVVLTVQSVNTIAETPIFFGEGVVRNRGRSYSVAWFSGKSLNEKWDFMRRGFPERNRSWHAVIPRPMEGDPAAVDVAEMGGVMWKVSAPLKFGDPESNGVVEFNAPLAADPDAVSLTSFIEISEFEKAENLEFRGLLRMYGGGREVDGVLVRGGAHIYFGNIYASHLRTAVKISSVQFSANDISFSEIYSAYQSSSVVLVEGLRGGQAQNIRVGHVSTDGADERVLVSDVVRLRGVVRNFRVEGVTTFAVVGGLKDVAVSSVLVEATDDGAPRYQLNIGPIYNYSRRQLAASAVLRNAGSHCSEKISDIHFYGGGYRSGGGVAFDIDWADAVVLSNHTTGRVVVRGSSSNIAIRDVPEDSIANFGLSTRLNGRLMVEQKRGLP